MKVYIVRHGQTVANSLKIHNTEKEELTELGIKQAGELRDKIKDIDFDIIISSPLRRAVHTADIININNKKIIYDDRLKERGHGNLTGNSDALKNRHEYWNYNTTIQYGTSEKIKDFFNRVFCFLDELKTKEYNCVLIVAHAGVSRAFSAYFEGIKDGMFADRALKNCEIKEYEIV